MTKENLKRATLIAIKRPHIGKPFGDYTFCYTIRITGDSDSPLLYTALNLLFCQITEDYPEIIIQWGDGTETRISEIESGEMNPTHSYAAPGVYSIRVTGYVLDMRIRYFQTAGGYYDKSLIAINSRRTKPMRESSEHGFRVLQVNGCKSLAAIPSDFFQPHRWLVGDELFTGDESLPSVPSGIFAGFTGELSFDGCFAGCFQLRSIPDDLFSDAVDAGTFEECFMYCANLAVIPDGLFSQCVNAKSFMRCFDGCTSITEIPDDLFPQSGQIRNFFQCFKGCTGITGNVPPLWEMFPDVTYHDQCFGGCVNAANYADIPSDWK